MAQGDDIAIAVSTWSESELTVEEIHGIIEDYCRVAQIAIQSGFDG